MPKSMLRLCLPYVLKDLQRYEWTKFHLLTSAFRLFLIRSVLHWLIDIHRLQTAYINKLCSHTKGLLALTDDTEQGFP